MRQIPTNLATFLASNNTFNIVDLITLTVNPDGPSPVYYRWCTADVAITYNAHTFNPGPVIERGSTRLTNDLSVDTLDMTLYTGGKTTGDDIVYLAVTGSLDNARVTLERCFMGTFGDTSLGTVSLFSGVVSTVEPSSTAVRIQVKSDLEKFSRQIPPVIQNTCPYNIYSTPCGLNRANFTGHHTVGVNPTTKTIAASPTTAVDKGWVVFTSGPNLGVRRSIESNASGTLTLAIEAPYRPNVGDAFDVVQGCTGERGDCLARFNNLSHFGGYADVPPPSSN